MKVYDYTEARALMARRTRSFPVHPCVLVGWDNTPRRGRKGIVIVNSTPERFEEALRQSVASVSSSTKPEYRLVFLNAWNEWAEGNHLESGPEVRISIPQGGFRGGQRFGPLTP